MNYIVFDLEWNQSAFGRSGEHPRMPFEIIEIGAVKVNEKYEIISEFSSLIKPKIYKKLHNSIRAMLNYDENELKNGKPFQEACTEFLKWCGPEEYVFCTWGSTDLFYLQNNMDFYYMNKLPFPVKYYNLQQVYADRFTDDQAISKLEKAVQYFDIEVDEPFHAAINDARYTAKVMAAMNQKDILELYSYDLYRHPKKKEEEIADYHAGFFEFISKEFSCKRDALLDKDLIALNCCKCKKKTSKKMKWFQVTQNTSMAVGRCWYHGYVIGKIKFKSCGGSDDNVFAYKKVTLSDKSGLEELKKKQEDIREKRKQKRHEKNSSAE